MVLKHISFNRNFKVDFIFVLRTRIISHYSESRLVLQFRLYLLEASHNIQKLNWGIWQDNFFNDSVSLLKCVLSY